MIKSAIRISASVAILSVLAVAAASAQNLRATLFQETDAAFERAREAEAPLLSPQNFSEAEKYLQRAETSLEKNRSIERIKEDLLEANRYLRAADEASKLARVTFPNALQSRTAAVTAQAARLATEQWEEAEDDFLRAASALEDGNVNRARDYGAEALSTYRAAELTAIQGAILNEARTLIAAARDQRVERYAPKTLGSAEALVARAELDLEKDRYATEVPRAMARDAEYSARHAAHIADLAKALNDREITFEEAVLDWEQPLLDIAKALDSSTDMSNGYVVVRDASLARIENLKEANAAQREELDRLNLRVLDLEQSLGITRERAAAGERRREQIAKLEALFNPNEARILREGDKVIIRLIGLQFDTGQAVIQSNYFSLLRKISQASDIFLNASMIVEGHTDSTGSETANLALSERRANSVRDYLLADTVLGASQIKAVGYGETRPIANNETAAGRANNRRIDVVIIPDPDMP
jgi:OOP family OmpA-OmpF porin